MSTNRERVGELYESTLRPRIEALEGLRRSLKSYVIKALLLIGGPVVLFASSDLFLQSASAATTVVVNTVLFVAILAGVLIAATRYMVPALITQVNYTARFKREVVSDIFKVVSPQASYAASEGIPVDIFDAAGIFLTRGGTVSDDRVRGTIGRTPFEAAEIKRSYSTGGKKSTHHVVFHGLFFHLDFNKALKGLTIVQPEGQWRCELAPRDNVKKVVLENEAFEKKFAVYSTDEVEARYILTPAMMERIPALEDRADKPIFLAFTGNRAYLAVHFGRSLFEPSVAATTSREAIVEMADHFGMAEFVVEELDLNTRIWTKDVDDSLLTRPDEGARNLVDEAILTGETLTPGDLWKKAVSAGGGDTTHEPTPKPANTNIAIATTTDGVTVSYGLRLSFWVSLTLSVLGLLVFVSAMRTVAGEFGLGAIQPMLDALPVIPFVDSFVPQLGIAGVVAGAFVGGVTALGWVFFVRRVVISPGVIRVYRGLRPFARKYSRDTYNVILRASSCVFIGKSDGVSLVNPTASPNLSEEESKWVAWEMEQALKRT